MERDYLVVLTLALYRVTDIFPEKEPLRFVLRGKAHDILADSILIFSKNPLNLTKEQKNTVKERILKNIEVIRSYFEIAQKQNWLKEENFFVLKKEYNKIEREIERKMFQAEAKEAKRRKNPFSDDNLKLPAERERSQKILSFLKDRKIAQVKDLKEIFPEVSKRTLRRDFDYLLEKGLVERAGEGKFTFYKLK